MRVFYPDVPELPLPPGHRFPAGKYRALRALIESENLLGPMVELSPCPLADRGDLLLAHDAAYVDAVLEGRVPPAIQRRIGLPWSEIQRDRSRATVGGALTAARAALVDGFSGQLAGGTHHAHRETGSGFCTFNDLAVTSLKLIAEKAVEKIAIVDLDVHQGDGTAAILGQNPAVFTLSVHGEKNFPFVKPPSTLDVGLPDGTGDNAYLDRLSDALACVFAAEPEIVFFIAGADPLASDRLGRLSLTLDGLGHRDRMVLEACRRRAIPVAVVIGGGYAEPISDSVAAYAQTFRIAREVFGF